MLRGDPITIGQSVQARKLINFIYKGRWRMFPKKYYGSLTYQIYVRHNKPHVCKTTSSQNKLSHVVNDSNMDIQINERTIVHYSSHIFQHIHKLRCSI